MPNQKVIDFLYQNGFDDDDIEEFFHFENDGFDGRGNPFYGNDIIFARVSEEQKHIDLRETGDIIEKYWEKGWVAGYYQVHRSNFDSYHGRYYKVFPTRYKLWNFKFTKSLRRVLNKNSDLRYVIRPLRVTPEKSDLYDTYNFLRHGEPPREPLTKTYRYVNNDDSKKMELCVFKDKKLIACSFFEVGNFSTYGDAAFWDLNEPSRSLGTLTVLLEIKYAISLDMAYYYLGFFYAQNPAYHYKTRFPGLELYNWEQNSWVDFTYREKIKEMLKQKLPRRGSKSNEE